MFTSEVEDEKTAIFLVLVVLLIFFAIMMFTSALGDYFGKKAEMISLVAIAISAACHASAQ
jgi:uncharacterized membrane-anchored protein